MKKIFNFFVQRHLIANCLTIMIFLLGVNTLMSIKRDSYPHVDYGHMQITTFYPGASPEDVEKQVTNKIEKELKRVTGIKDYVSMSMENTSNIRVVIDTEVRDQDKVKNEVREAVNRVVDLPDEVMDAPMVEELNTALIPIIEVGISGDVTYKQMWDYARVFEKKLDRLSQVSSWGKFGWRAREIQIEVSPEKLQEYRVSLGEMISAIQKRNIRSTAGNFESFTDEKDIVTLSEFEDPMDVGDVIVRATFQGPLVKVSDLAAIKDDFKKPRRFSRINGKEAISFFVYKKEKADAVRATDAVKKLIEESRAGLPEGLELSVATDYSQYVRNRFQVVQTNALMGLGLVLILLTIFLNTRAAFWVAMGIPVSILGAIFLMPFFGAFLDSLTLSAMVMVLGIVVDDAIIISENIFRHRQMGKPPVEAAVDGIAEVFWPVMATIFTTFCAFAPMFNMSGIFGKFVFVMPLVIVLALLVSMLEVTIALPAHLRTSLGKATDTKPMRHWFDGCRIVFAKMLGGLLKTRWLIVPAFIALFIFTVIYSQKNMDFVLFPSKMAEKIYISAELPKGTTLQATAEKFRELEQLITALPAEEVASHVTRIGIDFYYDVESENHGFMGVSLTPFNRRTRTANEIVTALREQSEQLDGFVSVLYTIETGGPPVGKAINLYAVGSNDITREALTDEIVDQLSFIDGVKDIERGDKFGKDQLEIKPNFERLARLGLTVEDIARNSRIAFDGEIVTEVRYGEDDVDFRIINDKESRKNPKYLEELLIPNKNGKLIALSQAVDFVDTFTLSNYQHYNGERGVTIYADVEKEKISPLEAMRHIRTAINLEQDFPGTRIITGGEVFETERSIASLQRAFVIAVVAIYFLLVMLFQSLLQPFLVLIAIPFGLTGVVWAFKLHNEPISFLGMMGVIGLTGVVVNDSLVLVSHINGLRRQKPQASMLEIITEGTANRLRAIIMTTLTTVAGLLPLAYGLGGTDAFVAPMALALGYGVLFATPLTLVLIPCLYMIGYDIARVFGLTKPAQKLEEEPSEQRKAVQVEKIDAGWFEVQLNMEREQEEVKN